MTDDNYTPLTKDYLKDYLIANTDPVDFTCPRCGEAATGRFYGPCTKCRTELRQAQPAPTRPN